MKLMPYIKIARPDHWFKNVFMLPGVVLVDFFDAHVFTAGTWKGVLLGLLAAVLHLAAHVWTWQRIGGPDIHVIAALSLVGAGMRSNPSVASRLFSSLADAGVNIEMISTSEIRISVICDQADLEQAVRAVHTAFDLDAEDEAVVYGGTGR